MLLRHEVAVLRLNATSFQTDMGSTLAVAAIDLFLDLGTRLINNYLEVRLGPYPATQGGHVANPLVYATGPKPDMDTNNKITVGTTCTTSINVLMTLLLQFNFV